LLVFLAALVAATPILPTMLRKVFLAPGLRLGELLQEQRLLRGMWLAGCVGTMVFLLLVSGMNLAAGTYNPFIYFRF
jgi:hypothetical protein